MTDEAGTAAAVNRRYWGSDASVAEIAEELGISRRALYGAIQPESAGAECTECGGELVYPNRTSRSSGIGQCSDCGTEQVLGAEGEAGEDDSPFAFAGRRGAWIAGGLVAGALVGAAATLLVTRRR